MISTIQSAHLIKIDCESIIDVSAWINHLHICKNTIRIWLESKRERTQNETSMKFMSQTADDDQYQFGNGDEFHRILEMPKKMIRKPAPKFESTMYFDSVSKVSLEDFAGKYLVLFFYPYDFNKMFQEEILDFSENADKFKKLNCELLGCSIDSHFSHMNYCKKPRSEGGLGPIKFPLMADIDRKIVSDYGVVINIGNEAGTCLRSTFIIDDKQIVRHLAINDYAGHLKAEEILRMVQAIQEGDKAVTAVKTGGKSSSSGAIKVGAANPAAEKAEKAANAPKSLYERIGGEEAVTAAVGIFYKKMLADAKVSHFFKNIDMAKQHSQQISFLCFALGGPKKYVGKNMKDAHANLKLSKVEYDVTIGHLVSTLKDLKVDDALIGEIGKLIEPLEKEIVTVHSIFEQLGGEKSIEAAVEIFYTKMLDDKLLAPFFKTIDMARQKSMMRSFLTMALGGSKEYTGKNMKEAHKNMQITDAIFDATIGHLVATLQQLKVDEKILKQIGVMIEPLRKDIVSAEAKPPQLAAGSADVLPRKETNKTESTPTNASSKQKKYLIDRIGGPTKIDQLVGILLDRVYKDKRINSFFAMVEQQKLKGVVTAFLVQFSGGEKGYKGKNLREAHANLKVNDVQFNIFVTHLRESLMSMKVEPSVFYEFCNIFESFRGHVVTVRLSIYERLGGDKAITNISEKFFAKIGADPRAKDLISSTDPARIKEMQVNFVTFATGGGKMYGGKNIKEAHAGIKITDIHFNAFKENMQITLKELLVDPQTFQEISAMIETQRPAIVNVTLPLLDRLGGDNGILAVVNRFYDRVVLDPRVQKLFAGTDMKRLRGMQHSFLLFAVKGSPPYTGKNMKDAHARLALNDMHFNLIKDHLMQSMRDCSKDPLSMNEVGNLVEGLRKDIVTVKVPLVERIGGEVAMKKAVERFYQKASQDPKLKEKFANVDMNKLKNSNSNFLTKLMEGPDNYKGKSMKEAHAGLQINDQLFNVFKEYIVQSFRELGIDNVTLIEIAKVVESNRKDVVSVRPSLFERIGGETQMDIIIPKFYTKLCANPSIGSVFESIDGVKQKKMLKAFFVGVMGGQPVFKGKNLTAAHAHIKVTDAMFAEFRICMEQTLKEMQMNPLVIKDVSTVIEHFKKEIVR